MLHVIDFIVNKHDLRLVAVACVICGLASVTALQMLARARTALGRGRWAWVGAGGIAFGCGVWVTHFVSMLAFELNMPMAFDVPLTLLSLVWAIGGGWLALACGLGGTLRTIVAGLLLGAAIGAMHFTGMAAAEIPGVMSYRADDVAAAWAMGLFFAPLALLRLRLGHLAQAAVLLVIAVAGLHFTAMAALSIAPNAAVVAGLATTSLAISVAAMGLLVLLASLGGVLLDQHLERRAAREADRFRRLADATFEGLFFLRDDIVTDVNLVLCDMLGLADSDIVGAPIYNFFAPGCRDAVAALRQTGAGSVEVVLLHADGGTQAVDMLARPITDGAVNAAVMAVRDASERKRAEQRIRELAHTDPLTGVANRLLLQDRLSQGLAMAERSGGGLALLCLDLDRFKTVNDLLGHHAGDALLVEVAARLQASVRETDTVARMGGDEFIVLQPFVGQPQGTHALAQRLVAKLSEPYMIDGHAISVSASIGLSLYAKDADTGEALLRQADLALYRAKQDGRGCWRYYDTDMDSRLRARRDMERDLGQALPAGQFHLQYQPIFECTALQIVGYEALVRWRHPRRGNVPPSDFIPVAEACGVILAIGSWVLETACAEAASWSVHRTISVNLSPVQFKTQDLARLVSDVLSRTGLAPERLELEVTEGVLIENTAQALDALRAVKALGVRIALDDFGTGFSSLSYLRRFPFDRLKIDRSFVAELGLDKGADEIIRCILAMARSLRLAVTAEGVETGPQMDLLRTLKCSHLQGFLLGRPKSACELVGQMPARTVTAAATRLGNDTRDAASDAKSDTKPDESADRLLENTY